MDIAIVVSTYPPYAGGMGNAAASHARVLRARGHAVTVFSPQTSRARFRFGNAAVLTDALSRTQEFDTVLLEYPCFGTAELLAARRPKNLVLYYHMDTVGRGLQRPAFALHRRFVLPMILRFARRILVSSFDYARSSFLATVPWSRPWDQKVVEIPLGVDTVRFRPPGTSATGRSGRTILFVGGLDRAHYFKGLEILLLAMASLPNATLQVVGDGECRPRYERLALRLGIADRVQFRGQVAGDQLPSAYQRADVLVLPSVDRSEAFGMALLEAQASGIPVIASNLPGVRTALEDGKTGLLVSPGDATDLMYTLAGLLNDGRRRAAMGRAAREFVVEQFDEKLLGDRLEGVLL